MDAPLACWRRIQSISAGEYNQENVDVAYNPVQRQYLVVWNEGSSAGLRIAGQFQHPGLAGDGIQVV